MLGCLLTHVSSFLTQKHTWLVLFVAGPTLGGILARIMQIRGLARLRGSVFKGYMIYYMIYIAYNLIYNNLFVYFNTVMIDDDFRWFSRPKRKSYDFKINMNKSFTNCCQPSQACLSPCVCSRLCPKKTNNLLSSST